LSVSKNKKLKQPEKNRENSGDSIIIGKEFKTALVS
jgi:hypothetical protein